MEMSGDVRIGATVEEVWAALNDAEILRQCIPGCQELSGSPQEGFAATVKQKVGPVSATFKGAVALENVVPEQSYTIVGEGKGGVAGFAKGSADVTLVETEYGTELSYLANAKVGGKLAQLGSRIVGGFARKMSDQFFDRLQEQIENS